MGPRQRLMGVETAVLFGDGEGFLLNIYLGNMGFLLALSWAS